MAVASVRKNSALRCFAVRLRPGQEIKETLLKFVEQNQLKGAFVLSCVGSVRCAKLRLADATKVLEISENHEIVSLVGTLSAGGHLHASLSDKSGQVVGGHVMGNMIVFTTAEVVIGNCETLSFTREMDSNTGYDELVINTTS